VDEDENNKPKRQPIPGRIPRQEIELMISDDTGAHDDGTLRRA
jgi:hypothetical protein